MRYASIRDTDISNGEGIGISLFLQGCSRHCKGCFNQNTWDFDGGKEWTPEIEEKFLNLCKNPHRDFVSILGGEPFEQGAELIELIKKIRSVTDKPIYMWTGFKYEHLLNSMYKPIFNYIDYLIDGEFQEDKKDFHLKLRGSSNQRIIDIKKGTNIQDEAKDNT